MTELDPIDRSILNELQIDARMSNAELAERVGLVRRLEADGVIAGYVMIVNPEAINRSLDVFVEISLVSQSEANLRQFEKEVVECPEVMSCHLMAGDADYLLHLAVADQRDFERIHNQYLSRFSGVGRLRSSFAIRSVWETTRHEL